MKSTAFARYVAVTLCVSMILMMGAPAYASGQEIQYNDTKLVLSIPLIEEGLEPMIAMKDVADIMGGALKWDEANRTITLTIDESSYLFKPGSQTVGTGTTSTTVMMKSGVVLREGRSFVPLSAFKDVFSGVVTQENGLWSLTLAAATDKAYGTYSFDELYALAIENSDALKQAAMNIERSELVNDEKSDLHTSGLPSETGNGASDAVRLSNLASLKGSEISLKTAEIAYLTTKDQIRYKLNTLIEKKQVTTSALKLAQMDLENKTLESAQSALKYEQGLISLFDYEKSKNDLAVKSNALKIKESENAAVNLSLENMLRLGATGYEFLATTDVTLELLKDIDPEAHIADVIESSPTIWALEQQIALNQLSVSYYVFNVGGDPYDAKKIDVSKAKLTLQQTKDQTALSLRQSFESLKQLEQTMGNLEFELEKSKQDSNKATLNYGVGLITKLNLVQADYAVQYLENQIKSTKATYNSLKRAYDQPWAAQ